jgi:phosphate transport system substrate-binding protein
MRCDTLLLLLAVAACGAGRRPGDLVAVDGSSTVFPLSEAVAEAFREEGDARVTVGQSGTGGGFKKLCQREIAIAAASRPIRADELASCTANGVEVVQLPIAYDGIAILAHPEATWIDAITVGELAQTWAPQAQGRVMRWRDVRPQWPDQELHLFGAGVGSGTYDYFTQAIVGTAHASRGDYTASEDDNLLVQGIARDRLALGFVGYAYWAENAEALKLVAVDDGNDGNGRGAVLPTPTSVSDGTYQPLSRPVFLYVRTAMRDQPAVARFVDFYLRSAEALSREVGFIPLSPAGYADSRARWAGDGVAAGASAP